MKETFPHNRKHSHRHVYGSFGISEGKINKNTHTHTHTHTEYSPNNNYQWISGSDVHVGHLQVGSGQGGPYGKDWA